MPKMLVKRDAGSNRYCGPAALSLLTGRHVDECAAELRRNRAAWRPDKRHAIRGCHYWELLRVLSDWNFATEVLHERLDWPKKRVPFRPRKRSGFRLRRTMGPPLAQAEAVYADAHSSLWGETTLHPTLAAFLKWRRDRRSDQQFLLSTKSHFLVLRGRKLYDNLNPDGVSIRAYKHRRSRIVKAWEVDG